jgi:hypothetical protein
MGFEIDCKEAGRRLGVSRQRVIQLTSEACPQCQGVGCERCRKTGKRLPSRRACCGPKGRVMIRVEDLALVQERKVGRPKKDLTE